MKAMILAAGHGTRLRPFSFKRPKPLFPVLGVPLIYYHLKQLISSGCKPIVVNAHYLGDQMRTHLEGNPFVILQQEEEILGTGGGLRRALQHFDETPVLVVNGDIFHTIDLAAVYEKHLQSNATITLVLHDYPRFNTVQVSDDGLVTGFATAEKAVGGKGRTLAFTGIHVIDPAVLAMIPGNEFYNIIDCYRQVLQDGGRINALELQGHFWKDIGTPEDYLGLHAALLTGKDVPASHKQRKPFYCAANVQMGRDVILSDWVSMGQDVRVGDGARLERVVVWDGADIPAGAHYHDTIII
ncbi:MAG: NTP transferase domain-containing protein [Proteobacteria bacterium]|nr:NTP transferase domain-containing protein [Pseudomonadota bacterium]MBU1711108.1 NTP transferase domain-containing protein [Pseudomonadota bacterium]